MEKKAKAINAVNRILTIAVYIFYPALIIYLFVIGIDILPYVLVPGISFVAVSIFRYIVNAPRPYEKPGTPEPLIKKYKPGKSFPSRHVFSIFIIGVTAFMIWPTAGIAIGLAGIILAWIRVAGGVHYPRDVIAGAIIGVGLGVIGYAAFAAMV